jgi:molybdopterin-guanine dinucleotide biosynthesis adapter protein
VRVVAIIGESGAGKTTLIAGLIRHFVSKGSRVAAIKHTHHPLNEERRGDTAKFEAAGADPVIFAGDREAIVFGPTGLERIRFDSPRDLLGRTNADVVIVEGFKTYEGWPRIELDRTRPLSVAEALVNLDRIWASR